MGSRGKIRTYTYQELAREIFHVRVETVRAWRYKGLFRPCGYIRKGKWKRIALVDETTVKKLMFQKIIRPDLFDGRMNRKKSVS